MQTHHMIIDGQMYNPIEGKLECMGQVIDEKLIDRWPKTLPLHQNRMLLKTKELVGLRQFTVNDIAGNPWIIEIYLHPLKGAVFMSKEMMKGTLGYSVFALLLNSEDKNLMPTKTHVIEDETKMIKEEIGKMVLFTYPNELKVKSRVSEDVTFKPPETVITYKEGGKRNGR